MKQYIGARYVPKFYVDVTGGNNWSDSVPYEPLTIVTHLNTFYISRKTVPVGVSISNTEYWLVTGSYNSQFESYRQAVLSVMPAVENLSGAIYVIQGTDATSINSELTANSNKLCVFKCMEYNLDAVLNIPRNARVYLNGATLNRTGNAHDILSLDSNTTVWGGTLDGKTIDDNLSNINAGDRFCNIRIVNASDVVIRDMVITGNCSAEIQSYDVTAGVLADRCSNVHINNITADKNYGSAIMIYRSTNCTISDCYMSNNGGSGITSYDADDMHVSNCEAVSNGVDYSSVGQHKANFTGISLNGIDITCTNCTSKHNTGAGFTMGHDVSKDKNITLSNFSTADNGDFSAGTLEGVYVQCENGCISNGNITEESRSIIVEQGANCNITNVTTKGCKSEMWIKGNGNISNLYSIGASAGMSVGHVDQHWDSVCLVANSYFKNVGGESSGGAILSNTGSTTRIVNCDFEGDPSRFGGVVCGSGSHTYILDCNFNNITNPYVGAPTLYRNQTGIIQ